MILGSPPKLHPPGGNFPCRTSLLDSGLYFGRMRSVFHIFLATALFLASLSCEKKSASHHGIQISFQNQLYRPAEIEQLENGFDNGVAEAAKSGVIANQGTKAIRSYRLGWRIVRGQHSEYQYGTIIELAEPLPSGAKTRFPWQGITMSALDKLGADSIKFFVAEVTFSDGSTWKEEHPPIQ
jgi:hypothetical protein